MPVQIQFDPNKAPQTIQFNVEALQAYENAGGGTPMYLYENGKRLTACVLLVQYGRQHADPSMNHGRAKKMVQQYLDNGGRMNDLYKKLLKAIMESGVYGDPEDADTIITDDEVPTVPS